MRSNARRTTIAFGCVLDHERTRAPQCPISTDPLSPRVPALDAVAENDSLRVVLAGDWLLGGELPSSQPVSSAVARTPPPARVGFDTTAVGRWDSGLVTRLIDIHRDAEQHGVAVDDSGLPDGARRLIALAFAVKAREGAERKTRTVGFVQQMGEGAQALWQSRVDFTTFLGEATLSVGRFATGRAKYLRSDVIQHIQEAGANALPIVSLISLLIGMIFAFVGVSQLRNSAPASIPRTWSPSR